MPQLSPDGLRAVADIAQRTGFNADAVTSMLYAVIAGNGRMAQFSHPEFGGSGQWMGSGAIMLSDMFNNSLKARVDALCGELSALVLRDPERMTTATSSFQSQSQGGGGAFVGGPSSFLTPDPSANWWPADLGAPSTLGAQNAARYAYFPGARRLAIDLDGKVTVYDTQDHQIGGVSQQQSGSGSLTFTSQFGTVDVAHLPVVSGEAPRHAAPPTAELSAPPPAPIVETIAPRPAPTPAPAASPPPPPAAASGRESAGHDAILNAIERLADFRGRGILTDEEFAAKKAELLSRL
jgi:hypothetical protein